MHEQNSAPVAEMCRSTCQFTECRHEECADTQGPLEPRRTHDGQWLENPAQSATCEGKCEGCTQTDVGSVCFSRGGNLELQEISCKTERLEAVGFTPHDSGKSLHPENKTGLVSITRPIGVVNTENVMQLLKYQRYRCALTGRKLTPQTAALDHVVPIQRDGEHAIENTQVLHKDVNRAKGSLTNQEFIQLCHEVVLWPKIETSNEESK